MLINLFSTFEAADFRFRIVGPSCRQFFNYGLEFTTTLRYWDVRLKPTIRLNRVEEVKQQQHQVTFKCTVLET